MNNATYQKSGSLVNRYLELNKSIKKGYTSTNISDLYNLCYDCILLLSEMNCEYSTSLVRRRKARHERLRKQLFNKK